MYSHRGTYFNAPFTAPFTLLLIPSTPSTTSSTAATFTNIENVKVYLAITISARVNIAYK